MTRGRGRGGSVGGREVWGGQGLRGEGRRAEGDEMGKRLAWEVAVSGLLGVVRGV